MESVVPYTGFAEVSNSDILAMKKEGYDCARLAEAAAEHGTPLQVASRRKLEGNLALARETLRPFGWQDNIFYSYKTNPVPEVLKILHQGGAGAEVISERELDLALSLGVPPDRIVFNGIYKSPTALGTAVERGIRCVNIDAPQELEILSALAGKTGRRVPVGLRVRPSVGWQGQFGFPIGDGSARGMARRISADKGLDLGVIHFHLGTSDFKAYRRAMDETLGFIRELKQNMDIGIKALDIGGGFPGRDMRMLALWEQAWLRFFDRPWPFKMPAPDDGFKVLGETADHFSRAVKKRGLEGLELWCEPGRLITGDAQVLLVRVVALRRSGNVNYAIVDGGRVGAAAPLAGETRRIRNLTSRPGQYARYDLVGPTCMPWDRLAAGVSLNKVEIGDIICIEGAGAYFVPLETEFSFNRPTFILGNL